MHLDGKTAIVTGAGRGIGMEIAYLLAKEGAIVTVNDPGLGRSGEDVGETPAAEVAAQIRADGGKAEANMDSVADYDATGRMVQKVVADHGKVNLLFNNAGVSVTGLAEKISIEDFEWLMNINFWGVIYGCNSFLPHMHQVDEAAIVNTSSIFGSLAFPTQSAYNASKFAVRGYTLALRQELRTTPIGVSCVQPGGVKTKIVASSRFIPEDNQTTSKEEFVEMFQRNARLTSDEAAAQILKGVLKNKARILVGTDAKIMSAVERIAPTWYMKIVEYLDR